jgi:2'-5' RNA ligase
MYYLVAHMIDPVPEGSTVAALPLHMTIVHWFRSEASLGELEKTIIGVGRGHKAFKAKVAADAMFGSDKNVPVSQVIRDADLFRLHNQLVSHLEKVGITHTELQWVREGWNPHVTHKPNRRLNEGEELWVNAIDLISATSITSQRIIVRKIALSQP